MSYLLDINVLIARIDPRHEFHSIARDWLRHRSNAQIVTCPITENGFLRIYGHPNYPGGPGSPEMACLDLLAIRALPNHQFISDSLSIADSARLNSLKGVKPKNLTDIYLLALAVAHGHELVTFDQAIPAELVPKGREALKILKG